MMNIPTIDLALTGANICWAASSISKKLSRKSEAERSRRIFAPS